MKTKLLFGMFLILQISYSQDSIISVEKKKIYSRSSVSDGDKNNCSCVTKEICDIIIDFNNRNEICLPKDIKRGDFYRVVFKNFNKNIYNVSINNTNVDIIKAIEVPNFSSISLDNLIKLTSTFNYGTNPKTTIDDSLSFQKSGNTDKFIFYLNEGLYHNIKNLTPTENIIKRIEAYKKLTEAIIIIKNNIDLIKDDIYAYKNHYIYDSDLGSESDLKILIQNLRLNRNDLDNLLAALIEQSNQFEKIISDSKKLSQDDLKNIEGFRKLHQEATTKINELRDSLSAEKIDALFTMIIHLSKESYYYSFPIQFTKDQSELKIELTPKNDKIPFQKEIIGPYTFPMVFPSYWSVGSSFYAGFGFKNERYSVISSVENEVSTYQIVKEESDNLEIGFSALVHRGKKFKNMSDIGLHITFGPGVSIEKNPRPRLLLGGGLSYGDKHNFSLDVGLIAGYVDTKSITVNENELYTVEPTNLTITKLKAGGFFSIGYFFKIN